MKILFVATVSNSILFVEKQIDILLNNGHKVGIACNISSPIKQELLDRGVKTYNLQFSRNPFYISNLRALASLKRIVREEDYRVIHTLTPIASVAARWARLFNKEAILIYTAHGFHFYRGAPLHNWLIYYPIEKIFSYVTDYLITINSEDFEFAKRHLRTRNGSILFVHGVGIDTRKFIMDVGMRKNKRMELCIPEAAKLLVSVGELNENKNHSIVVRALGQINDSNLHYIICGNGHLAKQLSMLAKELDISERVHLLGYREDISEILNAADVFVLPSKREGLPVSLMEAMSVGLPVICSDIRGNRDLIQDGLGGFLFKSNDVYSLKEKLLNAFSSDIDSMREYNIRFIKNFTLDKVLKEMQDIYTAIERQITGSI